MTGAAKQAWGRFICLGTPPIAFMTTMPGYGLIEVMDKEFFGAYDSRWDHSGLGPLENYGSSFTFTLAALVFWMFSFGVFAGSLPRPASRHALVCALTATILCVLSKYFDLLYENQIFTGNYWALLTGSILLTANRPLRKTEMKLTRTWLIVFGSSIVVLWAALAFAFAGNWFGPEGDALKAAGAGAIGVLVASGLAFVAAPRIGRSIPSQPETGN